jgi:hypothetical protein
MDTANDDNGVPEELLGWHWTSRTVTDEQLSRVYGRPVCGSESPISDDHGAWVREYDGQGEILGWRYYRDPNG